MGNEKYANEKTLEDFINNMITTSNVQTSEDLLNLRDNTIELILTCFSKYLTPNKTDGTPIDFISSNQVTIEVKDEKTNKIFRRILDLSYVENSNGLKLIGEDFNGQPSEIVFLSDTAVKKIIDVTGYGPDKSICKK